MSRWSARSMSQGLRVLVLAPLKPRPSRGFLLPAQIINRAQEQQHFAQADRHIAEVKAHTARQRVILTRTLAAGHPSELAESILHAFRIFEKHRELILDQLKRRPAQPPSAATCSNGGGHFSSTFADNRRTMLTIEPLSQSDRASSQLLLFRLTGTQSG